MFRIEVTLLFPRPKRPVTGVSDTWAITGQVQATEDRRLAVCAEGGNPEWVLALGRDLAEFLKVPMVDQTSPVSEAVSSERQTG